ncbi:MAG TPA: BLUF domain-containing protein [Sphingomonas sp.]|nr:BLUF domain-containing protein [Sphingomonas sp.]
MDKTLVYVSAKTPQFYERANAMGDIVLAAQARNAELGVTGALIETANGFAQMLEGNAASLDDLMESIDRDPRHSCVSILAERTSDRRRLSDWSMAYSGESSWVAQQIEPLIGAALPRAARRVERLEALLLGLATSPIGKAAATH